MPRLDPFTHKPQKRRLLLGTIAFLAVLALLSIRNPRKTRCTAGSRDSHCPQPFPCVDSHTAQQGPRPLVVIAAGGHRAASTFLYNALRILLRIRDPNTVAGWYVDLQKLYATYAQAMPRNGTLRDISDGNRLEAFKSVGSLLVKIHTVRDWHDFLGGGAREPVMQGAVDAVYTSHRDLRNAVRSIRDMGWGVAHTREQRLERDFCRRKPPGATPPPFLRREEYAAADTWVAVARSLMRCREVLLETAGSALKMDVRAEDVADMEFGETVAVLRELGRDLDYAFSDSELELAARELRLLRPGRCDCGFDVEMGVNPVTHLHKGHVRTGGGREAQGGMAAIGRDAECAKWLRQHVYDV